MDMNIPKLAKMICSGNLGDILLACEIINKNENKFFSSFQNRLTSNPQYCVIGQFNSDTKLTNTILPEVILFKKHLLVFGTYVVFRKKEAKDHLFYKVIANYEQEAL